MLPFKKILCPTDFSEPSYQALDAARELAAAFSSSLLVIHVAALVQPLTFGGTTPAAFNVDHYQRELVENSQAFLESLIAERFPAGFDVKAIVRLGAPAYEIAETAEKEKVDLIVIATHGRTGLERFIYGSVAERVLRFASCPVLAIHAAQVEK
ncbi:MAG: universal stress protein [Pseudomonadota bacterium]